MANKKDNTGFSNRSYTPSSTTANPDLLNPLNTKVDPLDQQAKEKEKDQMVGLNDKFVAYIDKVRHLEEKNEALQTKLKILQDQDAYKGNVDAIVKELETNLKRQIDDLKRDHKKLEAQVNKSQDDKEKARAKFEDELRRKEEQETDFLITKRDVDKGFLQKVELELDLEDLQKQMEFLKRGFEEEIKELESQICNETVMIKRDCSRDLDMDDIINMVKRQYEEMATRSREEVEQWHMRKMDDFVLRAGKHEQDVKDVKKEISDIQRIIQKLNGERDAVNRRKEALENDIKSSENDGEKALKDARAHIAELEDALRRDKQVMARQVREYQELMNLKLALDIEIATYKKLLEGEEIRMADNLRNMHDF